MLDIMDIISKSLLKLAEYLRAFVYPILTAIFAALNYYKIMDLIETWLKDCRFPEVWLKRLRFLVTINTFTYFLIMLVFGLCWIYVNAKDFSAACKNVASNSK